MAEQNDGQEWDESDESGDESYTALMENQQSDQQMATMAGGGQLNLIGPSQLGGGNTQNINPTFNDRSNSNNNVYTYNNCTFVLNNDNYTQMTHSFHVEGDQQLPRLSDNPPSGKLTEQCLHHMHNCIQAQSSWTVSRCPTSGSPILPDQSPPTPSQPVATGSSQTLEPTPSSCPQGQSQMKQINDGFVRSRLAPSQPVSSRPCSTDSRQDTRPQAGLKREDNQLAPKKQQRRSEMLLRRDEQFKSQLHRCFGSTETNADSSVDIKDIQSPPTKTLDSVTIADRYGCKLKPGDGVLVQSDWRSSGYLGLYVGDRHVITCDIHSQKVMMETVDNTQQINKMTPYSSTKCQFFSAETRADRARSCVGKVSPVLETWNGLDLVTWTWTGLNWHQAGQEGFRLSY